MSVRRRRASALVAYTLGLLAAGAVLSGGDELPLTPAQYVADFDELWEHLANEYAYFDKKATDWDRVREIYRPRAALTASHAQFVGLLEEVLEELYDSHAQLTTNTPHSPRLVPTGLDVWAHWRNGKAVVEEVRAGSEAQAAGLRPGMEILSINGVPITEAARRRIGRSLTRPDPAADEWALRAVLAGRHDEERALVATLGDATRAFVLAREPAGDAAEARLETKQLEAGIGYLRVRNSLGDLDLIPEFDAALKDLRKARALILDLRDTPSGGNTTVARGILGRFVEREEPYQRHVLPGEERRYGVKRSWIELVSPRGPFAYRAPVVVLVSHWTGSMGEGLAVGMAAAAGATVVGTPMAGLAGATYTYRLPNTHIGVNAPAETLFHVNGLPREDFVPAVRVDLATAPLGPGGDPILDAGVAVLRDTLQ